MSYDNTNSGVLFRNDKKQSDKSPDYRGTINVEGQEFWLSAWLKTSKKNNKFMSLSITPKGQSSERRQPAPEFDDDIPF